MQNQKWRDNDEGVDPDFEYDDTVASVQLVNVDESLVFMKSGRVILYGVSSGICTEHVPVPGTAARAYHDVRAQKERNGVSGNSKVSTALAGAYDMVRADSLTRYVYEIGEKSFVVRGTQPLDAPYISVFATSTGINAISHGAL